MRRNTYLLILISLLLGSSCKKRFEIEPEERILTSDVFDPKDVAGVLALQYLYGIYSYLPTGFNRVGGDYLDAGTDDAVSSVASGGSVNTFTNGQLTALNYPDNSWENSYTMIRNSNVFLKNIGVVPLDVNIKKRVIAEARFLRAFAYFELLKRYGGVPLVQDTIFKLEDNLNIPRNTFAECTEYIISECDVSAIDLPLGSTIASGEFGRIPREAALALKCRLYLYAASPLFNGGGFESNSQIRVLTGYATADPTRWQKVIDAAKTLIDVGFYKLPTGSGTATYSSVFTTKVNTDIILSRQSGNSTSIETTNAPVGYVAPAASNGRTSPTQNFVNAFPNLDGSPYTGSSTDTNQYKNRDPRLNAIIFYNGVRWLNRPVETFEGGLDKPNAPYKIQTQTSYYLRKFMGDFTTSTSYSNQSHNFPYFRFAEVLLNYAEGLNEIGGRTEEAVTQLISIRRRAGITAGTNNRYGIPSGISQSALRDLIRNDRRIELAFEEHRFWDIRRWKLTPADLSTNLKGLTIDKTGTVFTFSEKTIGTTFFQEKYYHMPIPYSEIIKNNQLIQNEGYE